MSVSKARLSGATPLLGVESTPTNFSPAAEVMRIPDRPRTVPVPDVGRNYRTARAAFGGLFKANTPDLELKKSAKQLGESALRNSLVAFVRASGLDLPREVYRSRASVAERKAIGAATIPKKVAWLTLAFDSFLMAARFDRPTGFKRSQRDATNTAELIASVAPDSATAHYWSAAAAILRDDVATAESNLEAANAMDLDDDQQAAIDHLLTHLANREATTAIEAAAKEIASGRAGDSRLEALRDSIDDISTRFPRRAVRCEALKLAVESQLVSLGAAEPVADPSQRLRAAFDRAAKAVGEDVTTVELLRGETELMVARQLAMSGDTRGAELVLQPIVRGHDPARARNALQLLAEIAFDHRTDEASDRLRALHDATPSVEGRLFALSAWAAVPDARDEVLAGLNEVIDALQSRGSHRCDGVAMVDVRVEAHSKKSLDTPKLDLTSEEAFLLDDAVRTRALLLTSLGRGDEAFEDDRARARFAQSVGAVDSNFGVSEARDVLSARAKRYFAASSAYPLASASDFPVHRLFAASFISATEAPIATMSTYDAHIAMASTPMYGLARGTEHPVTTALRSLDPVDLPEFSGMTNTLLTRGAMQPQAIEILGNILGCEALLTATDHLGLDTLNDPALARFVDEQLALADHTRALTLGCSDARTVDQIEETLQRHGALESSGAGRAASADQILGHLSALASFGRLNPSKKPLRAKDESGVMRAAWREICAAVKTGELESLKTIDEARTAVRRLGFRAIAGRPDLFERNGAWVQISEQNIGEAQGYSLQVGNQTKSGVFQDYQKMVSVDGLTFEGKHWRYFQKGYERTRHRYATAMRRMVGHKNEWRSDMKGVRALIGLGRSFGVRTAETDGKVAAKKFEMGMELHELSMQAQRALESLQESGRAPKGVMIMVDGIDAASKTSNGERLMQIFERAGYEGEWKSFKAPTPEEREQHWLHRYDQHRPREGQVFMCDRSPLGDYAYNRGLGAPDLERMADDFRKWQEDMEKQGILVLNFLFYPGVREKPSKRKAKKAKEDVPDLWRPMFTFGKREGRALAAREMLMRAEAAGAPQDILDGLSQASELHPGLNDLRSFHDGVLVHRRFRAFADAIETEHRWKIIPTERRHKGRKRVLKFAVKRLEGLARDERGAST